MPRWIRNSVALGITVLTLFRFAPAVQAACSNPPGVKAAIVYNTNTRQLQYCNDTNWIAMGPAAAAATDLVGHWKLDEASGTLVDSSGNGNDGPNGGIIKGALDFDGADDEISVSGSSSLNDLNQFTYAAWIYPAGWGEGNEGDIFNKGSKKELRLLNGGGEQSIRAVVVGGPAANAVNNTIKLDQWQHVAVTYDNSGDRKLHIYVNGTEVSYTTQGSGGPPSSEAGESLAIGGWPNDATNPTIRTTRNFDGLIDDARLYNRALTATEIQSLYNMGVSDGLVAGWHLDETSGTTAVNFVSSSGNGTVNGSGSWLPAGGQINGTLDFIANNTYVQAASNPAIGLDGVSTATFAAWIYPPTFGENNQGRILDKGGGSSINSGYTFQIHNTTGEAKLLMQINSTVGDWSASSIDNAVTLNTWQHVAAVYDGAAGTVDFYVNGVSAGTDAIQGGTSIAANAQPLRIGRRATDFSRNFDGFIDEVRIYDRALTQTEIQAVMGAGADCTSPLGIEGKIVYNRNFHLFQYCNGTVWVAMGPAGPPVTPVDPGPTTGLVTRWKLDESGATTTATDSAGTNNATLVSFTDPSTAWQLAGGKINGTLQFDGADDYVASGAVFSGLGTSNQPYTLALWIKADAGETAGNILNSYISGLAGWRLAMLTLSGGRIVANSWKGSLSSATSTTTINTGEWYHVVTTWDSVNGLRLFINGWLDSAVPQATYGASGAANVVSLALGNLNGASGSTANSFAGMIDDVRIYDRALSESEILDFFIQCANPARLEGAMIYNTNVNAMQYCNGTDWKRIGK